MSRLKEPSTRVNVLCISEEPSFKITCIVGGRGVCGIFTLPRTVCQSLEMEEEDVENVVDTKHVKKRRRVWVNIFFVLSGRSRRDRSVT